MKQTTYHIGGAKAGPAGNRAEELDSVAGTFTRWDAAGAQIEQRVLTAAEVTSLATQETEATKLGNGALLRTRAGQALATNATYLGVAALPAGAALTTTQLTTAVRILRAEVDALAKQNNALIRLALGLLDDVSGT